MIRLILAGSQQNTRIAWEEDIGEDMKHTTQTVEEEAAAEGRRTGRGERGLVPDTRKAFAQSDAVIYGRASTHSACGTGKR